MSGFSVFADIRKFFCNNLSTRTTNLEQGKSASVPIRYANLTVCCAQLLYAVLGGLAYPPIHCQYYEPRYPKGCPASLFLRISASFFATTYRLARRISNRGNLQASLSATQTWQFAALNFYTQFLADSLAWFCSRKIHTVLALRVICLANYPSHKLCFAYLWGLDYFIRILSHDYFISNFSTTNNR